jgi:hypothetical protein
MANKSYRELSAELRERLKQNYRLAKALPEFLRDPITPAQAEEGIQQLLADRTASQRATHERRAPADRTLYEAYEKAKAANAQQIRDKIVVHLRMVYDTAADAYLKGAHPLLNSKGIFDSVAALQLMLALESGNFTLSSKTRRLPRKIWAISTL